MTTPAMRAASACAIWKRHAAFAWLKRHLELVAPMFAQLLQEPAGLIGRGIGCDRVHDLAPLDRLCGSVDGSGHVLQLRFRQRAALHTQPQGELQVFHRPHDLR